MVSPEQLLAARSVPILSLLPPDTVVLKKGNGKYMSMCSFHEETTPSMSLVKYPDGTWGYRCFSCSAHGDSIKYVQNTEGLDFMDAVKKLTGEARTAPLKPQVQCTYDYCDEQGVLYYQVVRYHPKAFRLRRRTDTGWAWCLDGMRRVLYRLPELLERSDETIYYVEGEKDVETLRSKGLVATTHATGANGFKPGLLDSLGPGSRRIVTVPDMDEPGKALMRQVYKAARDRGHSVQFLLLPEHKDVTEWFEAGKTLEDMLKEVK